MATHDIIIAVPGFINIRISTYFCLVLLRASGKI